MKWKPISEERIWDEIISAGKRMTPQQEKLWEVIRLDPQKWKQEPWGNEGNGFWVVAIYGNKIIWYNDIEDGFNRSSYKEFGEIVEYYCNQDELEWTLQYILDELRDGYPSGGHFGPPQAIA